MMRTITIITFAAFALAFACCRLAFASTPSPGAYQLIAKMEEVKKIDWEKFTHRSTNILSLDTVFVGAKPHDTLWITGTYSHTGPIFVFNDGVVIIQNAHVTNYGDVFVFGHGQILADSSSLTFPQNYFYQRSLLVVQSGIAIFNTCRFNYSGLQHNLVVSDNASVGFFNVHQDDWTTAGLSSHGTLLIDGMNLGGEYILSDACTANFYHIDSLLLWHHMPKTAYVNFGFPKGDSVFGYSFSGANPSIVGIGYSVTADNCHTVWWALMPVNGSQVQISGSNLRAIGMWFERGDSVTVTGLKDNTFYTLDPLPFKDRTLFLSSTYVQTWSLYVFDSSQINIYNCRVGEVGSQQHARILGQQFLLDGSGGYFWSTDSSAIYAYGDTVYSTARSEKNSIFVLSNSTLPFQTVSSIGNSLMVSVQNSLPADPVPYDHSAMWMENIELGSTAHADSLIPVRGSAWIDQGPQGSWIDFQNYSLSYRKKGAADWIPIVADSSVKIRHNALGVWNTKGLDTGMYTVRLFVKSNQSNGIEDTKDVLLLPSANSEVNTINENDLSARIYPNPANEYLNLSLPKDITDAEIRIYDLLGEMKFAASGNVIASRINIAGLAPGIYAIEIRSDNKIFRQKFIKP